MLGTESEKYVEDRLAGLWSSVLLRDGLLDIAEAS